MKLSLPGMASGQPGHFHHLSGDSHINSSLREGPLRHLTRRPEPSISARCFRKNHDPLALFMDAKLDVSKVPAE
jgi:hypothetical protein